MLPMTDAAATLGGRFTLVFHPCDRKVYHHAFGRFPGHPVELVLGVREPDGTLWRLPFCDTGSPFPFVEQSATLTTLGYRGVHPELGLEFSVTVRAPFYPRNLGISLSPLYYVDCTVRRLGEFRHVRPSALLQQGEILFGVGVGDAQVVGNGTGFRYEFPGDDADSGAAAGLAMTVPCWVESVDGAAARGPQICSPFDLQRDRGSAQMRLLWSSWVTEPVLEINGQPAAAKYLDVFETREEMLEWARTERTRIIARCDFLDRAVADSSLGVSASCLTAVAFHTFLANTWWARRQGQPDWFSVWEGTCAFHSTLDVEYNDALLYFALWPDLLEMLLDEWAAFENDGQETLGDAGAGTAFLCHDMGGGRAAGRMAYPHHMEVEENANYMLLLAAWAEFTGEAQQCREKLGLCRKLAEFIVRADTAGDGVPDVGVANTIDDAAPAAQFGRKQVYLAVKAQAALWALADLECRLDPRSSHAERWRAFASKSIKAIDERGWLVDHYAVVLDRDASGIRDPWSRELLPGGELAGWDGYSIYSANGMLYLFLAGIKCPRWKLNRFAEDVETAAAAAMRPYGCGHTDATGQAVWFSQNMWRDYVAAYLGVDMLANVERYWHYQVAQGASPSGSLYYDTTEENYLAFYPRGATVFGMPFAAAGLRLNRLDNQLALQPVRSTLRVPLLPLADWDEMRVPVLTVKSRQGVAVARISERDLLAGLGVSVTGAELEPA
jgi:hypothetical protein